MLRESAERERTHEGEGKKLPTESFQRERDFVERYVGLGESDFFGSPLADKLHIFAAAAAAALHAAVEILAWCSSARLIF